MYLRSCNQFNQRELLLTFTSIFLTYVTAEDFLSNYEVVPTLPPQSLGALKKCGEGVQKHKFKCVPYYNCDPLTNTIVDYPEVDGSDQIQPRINDQKCEHYLEVCCQIANPETHFLELAPTINLEFDSKCGVKSRSDTMEFPWMVALFKENSSTLEPFCGGSLISAAVIVTAAHCVQNLEPQQIVIKTGEWNIKSTHKESLFQERSVAEIVVHKHFLKSTLYNDVALLFLNESLTKNKNLETVCVPKSNETISLKNCLVTGWSRKESDDFVYILEKDNVNTVSHKNCQDNLRKKIGNEFILDKSFFCISRTSNYSICLSDGGGPLVCPDSSQRFFQVGIISWSVNCEKNTPTVYTNLIQFSGWMDNVLVERGYTKISHEPKKI